MAERLEGVGVSWTDVTQANIYTVHNLHPVLGAAILPALGDASRFGIRRQYARPPVHEIELEMDLRSVRREIVVG